MVFTSDVPEFTRREFVQIGACAVTLVASGKVWSSTSISPIRDFEHGSPLSEVGYGDVQLAAGPQQTQLDQTHTVFSTNCADEGLSPLPSMRCVAPTT